MIQLLTAPSRPRAATAAAPPLQALTVPTPAGPVGVLLTPEDDIVRAAGFWAPEALLERLSPVLRARGTVAGSLRCPAGAALQAYADGEIEALERAVVEQPGGPFQQLAWQAMRAVPAGRTVTYVALAAAAGSPAAVRAAGSACARNLVAPFVPCHRIVRTDGTLGGYFYGLGVKKALLRHEGQVAPR